MLVIFVFCLLNHTGRCPFCLYIWSQRTIDKGGREKCVHSNSGKCAEAGKIATLSYTHIFRDNTPVEGQTLAATHLSDSFSKYVRSYSN